MLPLNLAVQDEELVIKKIGGGGETRRHLENLGLVVGSPVTLVAVRNGNVIVKVKESRVALDGDMARKIMI